MCVNTQTPFLKFRLSYSELLEKYRLRSEPVDVAQLKQGEDFDATPGGVTSMVYPILMRMQDSGMLGSVRWISLAPNAPSVAKFRGIEFRNIWLEPTRLAKYANFKEGIWNEIHGMGSLNFVPSEYEAYVGYNWVCAKQMLEMLDEIDIFWIHDFQQLHIGNLIGPSAPAVLRWHIPFDLEKVSERLRTLVLKSIQGFDAIIVSTKRDLQGLIHAGYKGRAYAIYPYIDPGKWKQASDESIDALKARLGITNGDRVLCVVARMDPVKSQDLAVKTVAKLKSEFPSLKLVLVGNGSFTGSSKGGLGHPKSSLWRTYLESLISELRISENVILAGHLDDDELSALYALAEAVIVPSKIEGFNLTAVEGWVHNKPCIVSRGAGVSELVHPKVNGFTFDPLIDDDLTEKVAWVLRSPELSEKMGSTGRELAVQCSVEAAVDSLDTVFDEALQLYE